MELTAENTLKVFQKYFKRALLMLTMIFAVNIAFAGCDMCNLYLGLHPNQTKNSISLRYRFSLYESAKVHVHNGSSQSSITGTEWRTFQTMEVWNQWKIGRKIQLMFLIPYSMNSIENKGLVLDSYNHLGDIQGIVRYQLYRSDAEKHSYIHRIVIGAGIKAPTGLSSSLSNEGNLDPHIQTGTGSWDFLSNFGYLLKYKQWGVNQEVLFKINGVNKQSYQFANRFSSTTTIYYSIEKKDISVIPSIGTSVEYANQDKDHGANQSTTNGKAVYLIPGIDIYYKKLNWNISYQKPIIEDLRDVSMKNDYRWLIGMGISF